MIWKLCEIEPYIPEIKTLFLANHDHKHADNYLKYPLFQYTRFARMGWDPDLVYYSAGIERPEYNGSIRIMSRHTRDRDYNWGGYKADLIRGTETLDASTEYALNLGYTNIWLSREESPKLFEHFAERSRFNWKITYEQIPGINSHQHILRLQE